MSQENVQIIRRGYEAFASGRIAFEFLDTEIEWIGPREFPDLAEPRYGHEGVRQYMAKLSEVFDDYRMVAEEFIDVGEDQVLVFAREGGRGNAVGHAGKGCWYSRVGGAISGNAPGRAPSATTAR
jgi:ketosteroid isomerase-like protein